MKTIGFADFYLSEWHAIHYPAWIRTACERLGVDYRVAYCYAERDVSPVDGRTTAEWAAEYGVTPCATLEELCERSDFLIVLAPSDPDKHLPYAETVLKYGKRTYIDKTFAESLPAAKRIFDLAKRYGTPIFSTSALRYAKELDACPDCRQFLTTGNGSNLPEYVIHLIEPLVRQLGTGAEAIRAELAGETVSFRVRYPDDRAGAMLYARTMPSGAQMAGRDGRPVYAQFDTDYFSWLLTDILRFFETGVVPVPEAQTLEVMRIRDGALRAAATPGAWISLEA